MLNKKLNRSVSFLLVFFLSVLYTSARINPLTINNADSSQESILGDKLLLTPEFPLHPSMGNFIADYADDYEVLLRAVVVEHLLEVRHLPLAVGRVAVEAAGELVV